MEMWDEMRLNAAPLHVEQGSRLVVTIILKSLFKLLPIIQFML